MQESQDTISIDQISLDSQKIDINNIGIDKNFQDDIEQFGNSKDIINEKENLETLKLEKVESIKEINDAIPDKFTGWGLTSVIGCALFNFNTWGANSAYALYFEEYLNNDIFTNGSKYSYAIIGGLAFSSGLTFSPLINYLIGIIGVKPTLFLGIIICFVATILASFSTKLWEIYCTQGV
ncbi:hypothetical protein C6P40_004670, partial [Pichia californica]